MSYNTFPTLPGIGWPVKVTPKFKTIIQQAASGAEYRTGLWSSPLHEIEVPINYMTQADMSTLLAFFVGQQGALIPFWVTFPGNSFTANAIPFGNPWNGTATSAQLVDVNGNPISSASVSAIYRNDWQGNQLLYPTPRTQDIENTNLNTWGLYGPSGLPVVTTGISDPQGGTAAITVAYGNVVQQIYCALASGGTANASYSIWLRGHVGGEIVNLSGSNYGFNLSPLTTTWKLYTYTTTLDKGGYVQVGNNSVAMTVDVFAPMRLPYILSPIGVWIPNTTNGVLSVTDYTLSGTTVNLAQAPAAAATTTWNGTGSNAQTYLVRFPDGVDFEQFMSQLYRTKTLKLQEVR